MVLTMNLALRCFRESDFCTPTQDTEQGPWKVSKANSHEKKHYDSEVFSFLGKTSQFLTIYKDISSKVDRKAYIHQTPEGGRVNPFEIN